MSDNHGEIVYTPPQGNPFQDQATFMEACGQTTTEPNHLQTKLYERLIDEEYIELKSAKTAVDEADAVIDLIVVLIGYGFSRGWPMQALWNCVHATNIAKIDPETGKVRRREDGKVLKPIDWAPPNIEALIG